MLPHCGTVVIYPDKSSIHFKIAESKQDCHGMLLFYRTATCNTVLIRHSYLYSKGTIMQNFLDPVLELFVCIEACKYYFIWNQSLFCLNYYLPLDISIVYSWGTVTHNLACSKTSSICIKVSRLFSILR